MTVPYVQYRYFAKIPFHLNVTLYNSTGSSLQLKPLDQMFFRDGVAPQCRDGYKHKLLDQNDYHLRSNGLLFVFPSKYQCSGSRKNDNELITDEYCIDHFIDVDGTVIRTKKEINIFTNLN